MRDGHGGEHGLADAEHADYLLDRAAALQILVCLLDGPKTRAEMQDFTGRSPGTIHTRAEEMAEMGLIREEDRVGGGAQSQPAVVFGLGSNEARQAAVVAAQLFETMYPNDHRFTEPAQRRQPGARGRWADSP